MDRRTTRWMLGACAACALAWPGAAPAQTGGVALPAVVPLAVPQVLPQTAPLATSRTNPPASSAASGTQPAPVRSETTTVTDPSGRLITLPTQVVENPAYYFQNTYNQAYGAPAQPQPPQPPQRPPLPPADEPIRDHIAALSGLIDTDTALVRENAREFRLVDAIKVMSLGQARELRAQLIDSPVATGNSNILTQHLRAEKMLAPYHLVVGVLPERRVILVGVRSAEDL